MNAESQALTFHVSTHKILASARPCDASTGHEVEFYGHVRVPQYQSENCANIKEVLESGNM